MVLGLVPVFGIGTETLVIKGISLSRSRMSILPLVEGALIVTATTRATTHTTRVATHTITIPVIATVLTGGVVVFMEEVIVGVVVMAVEIVEMVAEFVEEVIVVVVVVIVEIVGVVAIDPGESRNM